MIANNLTPYEPTHPGEILKDEIKYRIQVMRKNKSFADRLAEISKMTAVF